MSVRIEYLIRATNFEDAKDTCNRIRYEQSVELPDNTLSEFIRENYVGKLGELQELSEGTYYAEIYYNHELFGDEFSQLLNVLFGNVSLFENVTICGLDWNSIPFFKELGPNFGIDEIRDLYQLPKRALTCSAIKPVGYNSKELGELTYQFALGGIDIIKDDHGLSNQSFSGFKSRVDSCMDAIKKAEQITQKRTAYFPNITADGDELLSRYEYALQKNCGGVLVCPQLTGYGAVFQLKKRFNKLPIMAHPAFSGSYVRDPIPSFTKSFFYGELWRSMGADFVVYPNFGGRFSFSLEDCLSINQCLRNKNIPFKTSLPTPGGGLQRDTIPKFLKDYGIDTVFLIGGSLYQHPDGIAKGSAEFLEMVSN